jgi:hypothetical protein
MPKYFFFDLDKTLTPSRSPMLPDHRALFRTLCESRDVVVVTGGTVQHIKEQVTREFDGLYFALAQSGNHAAKKDGTEIWYEPLTEVQKETILLFISKLRGHFGVAVKDENDLIDDRGAQIGYSVIGYHEDSDKKYAFDPGDIRRQAALATFPEDVEKLRAVDIEVVPAGTSGYNFYALGKHKGYNVRRFIDFMGWPADDCIYIGDARFPGGNDESVIGVVPTHPVKDPDETFSFVMKMLS